MRLLGIWQGEIAQGELGRRFGYAREAVRRRSPIGVFWLLGCRRREVGGAQQRDRQRVGRRRKRRLCDFAHPPAAEITWYV